MKSCPVFSQQSSGTVLFNITLSLLLCICCASPRALGLQSAKVKRSPGTGADTVGRTMKHWGVMEQAGPQHLLIVTTDVRGTNGTQDTQAVA